ncbi:MAG: Kelch repeat-containing protein [uncultured bacterium]|uniref:Fibronectin type-III domain-containing protein n=2 Tax=Candidatus Wolfeibacteriota TaxID=1752735 RepID=A0A0G1K631_9BACT|nr:MAG: Kelch repeat-containing protein [uncultured bacterium]KKR12406.1 MAG: hypothetical protein UT41_C0002G0180 [Candidatus Wolfebacteria bacterium GW2011_GWC2_39_22]KKT43314.1 MAG: hypothetical protein UW32_C0002G0175 [Candidatus Wolfebacteria bacterium GW2011_GWE2_44_13]
MEQFVKKKNLALSLPRGFTLVELLIVMGILTILATTSVVVFNPLEYNRQSRDTKRIGDLEAIQGAIETARISSPNISLGTSTNTVYVSLPDATLVGNATSTCGGVAGMPALPSGWQYQCVSTANVTKINGTGWLPINFDSLPVKSPLTKLPMDPKNETADRYFYTYIPQGGLTAKLESQKNIDSIGAKDGGIDNMLYEIGKAPNPIALAMPPTMVTNAATLMTQTTTRLNGTVNPNGSATNAWFRYATTNPGSCNNTFGTSTIAQAKGSGSAASAYTQDITGLSANTTYYYCGIGQNGGGLGYGVVQSFTTNRWARLLPGGSIPAARSSHTAVWDTNQDVLRVFGGYTSTGYIANDMQVYSPTTNAWSATTTPLSGRYGHAAAWDPTGSRMFIFGGYASEGSLTYKNDLWRYTGGVWTQLLPSGTAPYVRTNHSAVWDDAQDKLYIYGGSSTTTQYLGDLWTYNAGPNSWTKLVPSGTPPCARNNHDAVWDPVRSRLYIFGGSGETPCTGYMNDLWAYDVATNAWINLGPTGTKPAGRVGAKSAWNASRDAAYFYGGMLSGISYNAEVWQYAPATNAWTQITTTGMFPMLPGGTYQSGLGWRDLIDGFYIFGGYAGSYYNQTWMWKAQ